MVVLFGYVRVYVCVGVLIQSGVEKQQHAAKMEKQENFFLKRGRK